MQVVILAGGKGTRLYPYTVSLPKPLVPVGDKPILEIILLQLKKAGVSEIIISTGYLSDMIQSYFGDGKKWGVPIRYCREESPLNTAGALRLLEGLDENFLVINGDVLTDLNFKDLWSVHLKSESSATIAVRERYVDVDFGVIDIGKDNYLERYQEKPRISYNVSMGINCFRRRCVSHIRQGESIGMPDFLLRLKEKQEKVACYLNEARWLDIGRPEDYQLAQEEFTNSKEKYGV